MSWVIRPSLAEDEDCLVPMWLNAYANARDAQVDFPGDKVRFWRAYQPIVTALVRSADVRVLCDEKRAHYEPGRKAVIWAWSCTLGRRVFWVGVKWPIMRDLPEEARDMVRALLPDELDAPAVAEFHQMDLHRLGMLPEAWRTSHAWRVSMLNLSQALLEGDALSAVVGAHLLDPARPVWKPEAA